MPQNSRAALSGAKRRGVDMAAGTGPSFALLLGAIRPDGQLIAVQHSPVMMALASRRVRRSGWANVTLAALHTVDESNLRAPLRSPAS